MIFPFNFEPDTTIFDYRHVQSWVPAILSYRWFLMR
jgi:hypothetical protein